MRKIVLAFFCVLVVFFFMLTPVTLCANVSETLPNL